MVSAVSKRIDHILNIIIYLRQDELMKGIFAWIKRATNQKPHMQD